MRNDKRLVESGVGSLWIIYLPHLALAFPFDFAVVEVRK